uniref:Uncharacterized protein n=1 Tax=Phytophthora ramorum TaxID=164328 RepID=H3H9U8_PHYRM
MHCVTVSTNVTLVDSVSSRSVEVEVSHVVRSIPDPRSLVSAAMLEPVVVESTEDEAALVSMGALDVFGESLDSAAVWAEYWSVMVALRGVDLSRAVHGAVLSGLPLKVGVRGGGRLVELASLHTSPSDLLDGAEDGECTLEVHPTKSFAGIFNGSVVFAFHSKVAPLGTLEVAIPLRIDWRAKVVEKPTNATVNATGFLGPFELQSVVFENDTLELSPTSV